MLLNTTGRILSNYCVEFIVTWSCLRVRKWIEGTQLFGKVQRENF
jgi:hypothetical protein